MRYSPSPRWGAFLLITFMIAIVGFPRFSMVAQTADSVSSVAWSPDGSTIASATNTGRIQVWYVSTGELLNEFQGHEGMVSAISWSPDGSRFATTSPEDQMERVWNSRTGEMIAELPGDGYYEGLAFIAWNSTGAMLVSVAAVSDGSSPLHFWQVQGDNFRELSKTYNVAAYDIAWSPNGSQLAVANIIGIYIFDDFSSQTLEPRAIAPFHTSLAWSPDGTKLAATEVRSGAIDVLDPITGEIIISLQGPPRTPENGVAGIAWSSNGLIIADEYDGTVQSWDAETGELLETLSLDRQGGRLLMSLSPYGGRLALGSSAPVSETASLQRDPSIVQTLADGAVQIVVPAPSLERLQSIADACNAPAPVEQSLSANAQADPLSDFVAQVEALPEGTIPPACAADLIAVAQALQNQ